MKVSASLTNKIIETSTTVDDILIINSQFSFDVLESTLKGSIVGGSRMQSFGEICIVQVKAKDPDLEFDYNQDPDLKI